MTLPPAFVISLLASTDRRKTFTDAAQKAGLPFSFFDAVDGNAIDCKLEETPRDSRGNRTSKGALGCSLSHMALWRQLHESKDGDEWLIFEDDAMLTPDFAALYADRRAQLPDNWELFFVGWYGQFGYRRVDSLIGRFGQFYGTHSYLVRRTALDRLLETNKSCEWLLDINIQKHSLKVLHHYCAVPSLVKQATLENLDPSLTNPNRKPPVTWKRPIEDIEAEIAKLPTPNKLKLLERLLAERIQSDPDFAARLGESVSGRRKK